MSSKELRPDRINKKRLRRNKTFGRIDEGTGEKAGILVPSREEVKRARLNLIVIGKTGSPGIKI
jgi:hypothetical protein